MDNDLYYTCSLIEFIARKYKTRKIDIVNKIGKEMLNHIYEYADVNHCLTLGRVCDELNEIYNFTIGDWEFKDETQLESQDRFPTHWQIGKVYARLIENVNNGDLIETLFNVFDSDIAKAIDNYHTAMYYSNPMDHVDYYNAFQKLNLIDI